MPRQKTILIVFGTRPEAIKIAPLLHKFTENKDVNVVVCATGQHKEMLSQVLEVFDITVDYNLEVMAANQNLADLSGKILSGIIPILQSEKPDLMLVHGDTTTTLMSAITAFYEGVPVGHVEAGLRSGDLHSPFPEEFNRKAVSMVADWHFAPTKLNKNNLLDEGVPPEKIFVTGNTVVDALFWMLKQIDGCPKLKKTIKSKLQKELNFDPEKKKFILVTCHRRETIGSGQKGICKAISDLADSNKDVQFVFPVHPNPVVRNTVYQALSKIENICLVEPLAYECFGFLMSRCYLVITDSGGIQEEAPSLGKPVLVTRDVTERVEAVEAGTVHLVGTDPSIICLEAQKLLNDERHYHDTSENINPYGDGNAADKILKHISQIIFK